MTEDLAIRSVYEDEVSSGMLRTMAVFAEFGATVDEVGQAFDRISSSMEAGEQGAAQVANTLRTLVDESESARFALDNLEQAQQLAAAAGIKLEDAGRQLGASFRGQTDALRTLGGASSRVASVIDDVTDRQLRQRLITQQLNAGISGQTAFVDRLTNRLAPYNVQLAAMGLPTVSATTAVLGLTGAVVGAGAALASFATDSAQKYLAATGKVKTETEAASSAFDSLQTSIGAGLVEGLESVGVDFERITKGYTADLRVLTGFVEEATAIQKEHAGTVENVTGQLGLLYDVISGSHDIYNFQNQLSHVAQENLAAEAEVTRQAALAVMQELVPAYGTGAESARELAMAMLDDLTPAGQAGETVMGSLALSILESSGAMRDQAVAARLAAGALSNYSAQADAARAARQRSLQEGRSTVDAGGNISDPMAGPMPETGSFNEPGQGSRRRSGSGGGRRRNQPQTSQQLVNELFSGMQGRQSLHSTALKAGEGFTDELDQRDNAKSRAELSKQASEASQQFKAALEELEPELARMEEQARAIQAEQLELMRVNERLFDQLGGAGVQAFQNFAQAGSNALLSIGSDADSVGATFGDALFKSLEQIVPILSAYGASIIAAKTLKGAGVIAGAALLGTLLSRVRGAFESNTGNGVSSAGSPVGFESFTGGQLNRPTRSDGPIVVRIGDQEFRGYQQQLSQDLLDRGGLDLSQALAIQGG